MGIWRSNKIIDSNLVENDHRKKNKDVDQFLKRWSEIQRLNKNVNRRKKGK